MTDGDDGPNDSTLFYAMYLFNNAFIYFKMGCVGHGVDSVRSDCHLHRRPSGDAAEWPTTRGHDVANGDPAD